MSCNQRARGKRSPHAERRAGGTDLEKWPAALRGLHHVRAGRLRLGEGHVALVLHVWHGADENATKVEKMMGEKREALVKQSEAGN